MKETITEIQNPKITPFDSVDKEKYEWFPINFQWRAIYKLKENLIIEQKRR